MMNSLNRQRKLDIRYDRIAFITAAIAIALLVRVSMRHECTATPPLQPQMNESFFRSQGGQDRLVWERYFKETPRVSTGFFIEFGAMDGLEGSNSYFFEKALGWSGLLFEALPYEQKDGGATRPLAAFIDGGVCEEDGRVYFLNDSVPEQLGGRVEYYDAQRTAIYNIARAPTIPVACFQLSTILPLFGVEHVNYMSVDVEGSELQALHSFPWAEVVVDVVGVEVLIGDADRQRKEDAILDFMRRVGYRVAVHHKFASDTKDVFFVPAHGGFGRRRTHDPETFARAKSTCRALQRCI